MGTVQVRRTFRFSSSGFASTIYDDDAVFLAGAVGKVTNTTLAVLGLSAKIHRVSIWAPPASQGANTTCSIQWFSADGVKLAGEVTDTTMSTATPAYVTGTPPKGSLASFWVGNSGNAIFNLVAPAGSIVDVDATVVLNDRATALDTIGVSTAVLGQLYWVALDLSDGTHTLTPVSLPTTF